MWRRPQSHEHDQLARQQRILKLERELGIVPGSEAELTPLNERLQALCKRRDQLHAAIRSSPEPAQHQDLADLDREIREAIRQLGSLRDRITAGTFKRFDARPTQNRALPIGVTRVGRNRWIVHVRALDPATGSEKVQVHRVTGRRNRKMMADLVRATEARRRWETRLQ